MRAPSFNLEIPGNSEYKGLFRAKMDRIRDILVQELQTTVNNAAILETAMDYWLERHGTAKRQTEGVNANVVLSREDVNQPLQIASKDSMDTLLGVIHQHGQYCSGEVSIATENQRGHVAVYKLQCKSDKRHAYWWSSSPRLPNNKFLVNARVQHGLVCSGVLPSKYERFVSTTGIGKIGALTLRQFLDEHKLHIDAVYEESLQYGMLLEIGSYDVSEDPHGIEVMTDARHGWRKNAKDTSVVAIGCRSHHVLQHIHVTKADDLCTQRHERIGTKKLYSYFDDQDVSVAVHVHDRNMSINADVRTKPLTVNQNDVWHAIKALKKSLKSVAAGAKKRSGVTWHPELEDKVESVCTHAHWVVRNCEGDASVLRDRLCNITNHYEHEHSGCHPTSRCRMDANYEPRRLVTTELASNMLLNVITGSTLYKNAENYAMGRETFYVESFNNTINIFQDKRISFGDTQYLVRAQLAVCHWNENVDRDYTSVWHPKADPRAPRRVKGKKVYKGCTYKYTRNIWDKLMDALYTE